MPTHAEFAKHMGISRPRVTEMVGMGILPKGGTLDEWRIAAYQHATATKAGWATASGDLEAEKTRLTKAQADKTELEVAALEGKLIPFEDYERELGDLVMSARAKLLALPGKLAMAAMGAASIQEAELAAKKLIYEALNELAAGAGDDDGHDQAEPDPEPAPTRPARARSTRRKKGG